MEAPHEQERPPPTSRLHGVECGTRRKGSVQSRRGGWWQRRRPSTVTDGTAAGRAGRDGAGRGGTRRGGGTGGGRAVGRSVGQAAGRRAGGATQPRSAGVGEHIPPPQTPLLRGGGAPAGVCAPSGRGPRARPARGAARNWENKIGTARIFRNKLGLPEGAVCLPPPSPASHARNRKTPCEWARHLACRVPGGPPRRCASKMASGRRGGWEGGGSRAGPARRPKARWRGRHRRQTRHPRRVAFPSSVARPSRLPRPPHPKRSLRGCWRAQSPPAPGAPRGPQPAAVQPRCASVARWGGGALAPPRGTRVQRQQTGCGLLLGAKKPLGCTPCWATHNLQTQTL